jgi:hypothetical protein
VRTHTIKCWSAQFQAIVDGVKTFEFRKDDRGYQVGDLLELVEWFPEENRSGRGRSVQVTYILRGPNFGMPDGYVVMSIAKANREGT